MNRRRSKRLFKLFSLILLAVGVRVGLMRAYSAIASLHLFCLAEVTIEGTSLLNPKEIMAPSKIERGQNIFNINLKGVAVQVAKNPVIKKATISRKLPNKILISVVERRPIALINLDRLPVRTKRTQTGLYGIDNEGVLLPHSDPLLSLSLPILTGIRAQSYRVGDTIPSEGLSWGIKLLEEISRSAPSLLSEISEIDLTNPEKRVLYLLRSSTELRMGNGNLRHQVLCLRDLLSKLKAQRVSPVYIDLRFEGQVVVKI